MTEFERFLSGKEFIWKPGTERVRRAVSELNIKRGKSVIVAGTNGKGSTSHLIASILSEHGIKTGLFTSPHVERVNERFKIDLRQVSDRKLDEGFGKLKGIIEKHGLTYFESCFLLSLYLFRDCDISIFEVGMGGRLDATNAVEHDLAVLTHVDLDHERFLGSSIEEIAREKLSVARGRPLILSANRKEVLELSRSYTNTVFHYGVDFRAERVRLSLNETSFLYRDGDVEWEVETPLIGEHQAVNAATAIFSSKFLLKELDPDRLRKALKVKLPGRFQVFRKNPLIILDVAHNPDAVRGTVRTLRKLSLKVNVLYSGLKDKRVGEILEILYSYTSSCGRRLLVTSIEGGRGLSAKEISAIAGKMGVEVIPVEKARVEEIEEDTIIVGSFYLLSQVLSHR